MERKPSLFQHLHRRYRSKLPCWMLEVTLYLPRKTLNELCKLHVCPHFDYGDVI